MIEKKIRGNSRYVTYMVTGLILLMIIFFVGRSYLRNWNKCELKAVIIENNDVIPEDKIQSLVSPYLGQNIFMIDLNEIKTSILEVYRIEDVSIRRRLFDKLVVKVFERQGFINVITRDKKIFTLDKDAVVLNEFNYNKTDDFPIIDSGLYSRDFNAGASVQDESVLKILNYHKKILEAKPEIKNYISEYFLEDNDICFREIKSGKKVIIDLRYLDDNISMFFSMLESLRYDEYGTYIFKYKDKTIRK